MKKFDFKLQKLLDIRAQKENESKIIFKSAEDERVKAENNLKNLNDNFEKYSNRKINSVVDQKITHVYLKSLSSCIKIANEELIDKKNDVENKREDLKQRQIEKKTVEILRDKQRKKYIDDQNRIEQNQNDEFALYGYMRRFGEGR
ncbi:MAG: flagellar export protein FliJ [Clostridium sp.]|nr:flagellar export protein FliJ [Clostridium sp.]